MNILKKLFANQDTLHQEDHEALSHELQQNAKPEIAGPQALQSNVIPLPSPELLLNEAPEAPQQAKQVLVKGLIGSELVKAFFDQNHFGLGRHNGTNYRTIDAMEFGRNGRIAEFRNAIRGTVEQTQAKIDRLSSTQIEAEGVCKATSARLALAITQLERDLKVLNEQSELASDGKGWVLEALNRYQAGFVKGMREAVEAELILG